MTSKGDHVWVVMFHAHYETGVLVGIFARRFDAKMNVRKRLRRSYTRLEKYTRNPQRHAYVFELKDPYCEEWYTIKRRELL